MSFEHGFPHTSISLVLWKNFSVTSAIFCARMSLTSGVRSSFSLNVHRTWISPSNPPASLNVSTETWLGVNCILGMLATASLIAVLNFLRRHLHIRDAPKTSISGIMLCFNLFVFYYYIFLLRKVNSFGWLKISWYTHYRDHYFRGFFKPSCNFLVVSLYRFCFLLLKNLMQYFIRNKLVFAFLLFCLWLIFLFFMGLSLVIFIVWVLFILVAMIRVFLHIQASQYINNMKLGKIPMNIYTWAITKIIPVWIDSTNETYTAKKYVWSWYFEVKVPGISRIYTSDIGEYTGKSIFTLKDFIIYANTFVKTWDKVKVFVSKNKPDFYYIEYISAHKNKKIK